MGCAVRDNVSDGARIALVNSMALIDRECDQVRFTEFKSVFKQTFTSTPSSGTFYETNFDGKYGSKERRNSRSRSTDRNRGRNSQRDKSPFRPRRSSTTSPSHRN